jgi:hypothetical protein
LCAGHECFFGGCQFAFHSFAFLAEVIGEIRHVGGSEVFGCGKDVFDTACEQLKFFGFGTQLWWQFGSWGADAPSAVAEFP